MDAPYSYLPAAHQICKDKDEAEVWFVGLKALVTGSQSRKKVDSRTDGVLGFDAQSPVNRTRRTSPLGSPFGSTDSLHQVCSFTKNFLTLPVCRYLLWLL